MSHRNELSHEETNNLFAVGREQGVYCIGLSGTGKSSLLGRMILADIYEHGRGVAVFDPHGTLVRYILGWLDPSLFDQVVLLDASEQPPFGINLFECANPDNPDELMQTVENTISTFKRVWAVGDEFAWGARLEDLLRNIAYVLVSNQGTTLDDVRGLLYDEGRRSVLLQQVSDPAVIDFWEFDYPSAVKSRESRDARGSTVNKIRRFLTHPVVGEIVRSPKTTVDFQRVIADGQILLISLRRGRIGDEAVSLLGTTILTRLFDAALRRQDFSRLFSLYLDEFHRFTPEAMDDLFDEFRKFGFAATVAHQRRSQLPEEIRDAPLGAGTIVTFTVNHRDAEVLAGAFNARKQKEIIGERTEYEIARDPWTELQRNGHRSLAVMNAYFQAKEILEMVIGTARMRTQVSSSMLHPIREPDEALVGRFGARLDQVVREYFVKTRLEQDAARARGQADETVRQVVAAMPSITPDWVWSTFYEQVMKLSDSFDGLLGAALFVLWGELAQDPVMTSSGRMVPIERIRSISDVRGEIANDLTHLPAYVARIKQRWNGRELTLELAKPPPPPRGAGEREATIRKLSRRRYGRVPIGKGTRTISEQKKSKKVEIETGVGELSSDHVSVRRPVPRRKPS